MNKRTLRALTLLVLVCTVPLQAACNAMAGAGEDISRGGDALKKSADKHSY